MSDVIHFTLFIFTMKHIALYIIMLSFCSGLCLGQAPELPRIIAHRGYSSQAPENTLAAFRLAVEFNAPGIECDVRRTKDGKLVIFHDDNMNRLARDEKGQPVKGNVENFDLATLKKYDFGLWKGVQFKGETIPTLDEYLDLLKGSKSQAVIELKCNGIEKDVIDAVRSRKMKDAVLILSFDQASILRCRQEAPDIRAAWLCVKKKEESAPQYASRIISTLKYCQTSYVSMEQGSLTPEILQQLKSSGLSVLVWTCDNPNRTRALFNMGVESVTSNKLEEALKASGEKP